MIKNKRKRDNKGFSLIELIVAVLIISIISGSAVIALSSIFSTKVAAAAQSLQDALKQTRTAALTKENENDYSDGGLSDSKGYKTNIYAKLYVNDSELCVDVCTDYSGTEDVIYNKGIGSTNFSFEIYDKDDNKLATVDTSNPEAKIYFKKSTGGVSRFESPEITTSEIAYIRVNGPGAVDYRDVVLVTLTGRSYLIERGE